MTLATVVSLFVPSSPTAVAGLVIPAWVNAVDGQSCRGLAHVGKEIDEVEPPTAYDDAHASVILPAFMVRIGAAADHIRPNIIRESLALSGGLSVFQTASDGKVSFVASATTGMPCLQIADDGIAFFSAVADTAPSCVSHLRMVA